MDLNMENENKFSTVKDIVEFLAEKFPKCFVVKGECKPLKIGLFNDLAERVCAETPELSKTRLRHALRFYTTRWNYLEAFKEGAARVDLDGNEVDTVTAEQVEYATKNLETSKSVFEQKKKSQNAGAKRKFVKKPFRKTDGEKSAEGAEKPARNRKFSGAARQNRNQNSGAYKGNSIGTESFEQIDITTVDVGSKVHVLCGGSKAVEATVIEMAKDVVGVELVTGMVIRVSPDRIGR